MRGFIKAYDTANQSASLQEVCRRVQALLGDWLRGEHSRWIAYFNLNSVVDHSSMSFRTRVGLREKRHPSRSKRTNP